MRGLDLALAVALHLLAATVIGLLIHWQRSMPQETPRRIKVALVSAQQLDRLIHRKSPPRRPRHRAASPPKAAPPVKKPAPKPPRPAAPKRRPKPAPAFDPFAPLESPSNAAANASSPRQEAVELPGERLSQSELERYIARIRARVQAQWRVPVGIEAERDPLAEMRLSPDGQVVDVRIVESSGNAALDASLIRAIQAAAPFDLPREHFALFRVNRIRFHPLR